MTDLSATVDDRPWYRDASTGARLLGALNAAVWLSVLVRGIGQAYPADVGLAAFALVTVAVIVRRNAARNRLSRWSTLDDGDGGRDG